MQPAAGLADAPEFGERTLGVRNSLGHVPASDEIKRIGGQLQFEGIAGFEAHPRCERSVALARVGDGPFQDVDADDVRTGKQGGESCGDFAAPTADIGDPGIGSQRVARQEWLLLWPDGARLSREVAHHRFVGHLFGLGIASGTHGG